MRDPKRIDEMLGLLKTIWNSQPDTRFHQLMHNLQYEYIAATDETGWKVNRKVVQAYNSKVWMEDDTYIDMFHLEDDKFLNWLRNKVEQMEDVN